TGLLQPEDLVGGGHAMPPRYLEDQLGRSLRNLGLAAVDVYYVHNPETQLGSVPRKEFLARIRAAFEMLERQVAAGRVGQYGVATWNGFRTRPDAREHLSLAELGPARPPLRALDARHHGRARRHEPARARGGEPRRRARRAERGRRRVALPAGLKRWRSASPASTRAAATRARRTWWAARESPRTARASRPTGPSTS